MTTKILLLVACMLLLAAFGSSSASEAPPGIRLQHRAGNQSCSVLAAIPYWAQEQALESFEKHIDDIDFISVFWYYVAPEGKIGKYRMAQESRELIERAHAHDVKVLALIANLPDDQREGMDTTWDPERVGHIIRSRERRAAHIADLMELVRRMGFDGLYIDYEALPGDYREAFTAFIQELGAVLHAEGKLLAVALHPKTSEGDPRESNGSHAQDWDALHRHADQLHFMTYGEHTASTAPGPIAPPSWVERVLGYAVEERKVPRAKIYMGLPLYAEEWRERESGQPHGLDKDLTFDDVQQHEHEHDGTEMWSTEHQSPYMEYRDHDDRDHVIWFENQRSSRQKLAVAATLGVCNLSLWRLGGEDPGFWQLIHEDSRDGTGALPAPAEGGSGAEAGEADEDVEVSTVADRPTGDGYPKWVGDVQANLEYYAKVAATDPADKHDNWVSNMDVEQALQITPKLGLHSDIRVVLESDGEDRRFYTDFPYEGIYLRSLRLQYESDHYSVFGGKYEPVAGIWGYAPIFFGNYSTNLNLTGQVGLGASVSLDDETLGRHTLTGHAFYLDTSRFSGEVLTAQRRDERADGGPGNTGKPNNYLVTLDGDTEITGATFRYTLGGGVQRNAAGDGLDERAYVGALFGAIPLGQHGDLELSVDALSLRNVEGEAEDASSIGLGIGYSDWPIYLGAACSMRFVDPRQEDGKRTDLITEIVGRYGVGRFIVEAAYQNAREWGENDHMFGFVIGYMVEWLVH